MAEPAANATILLTIPGIFPTPQQLQGFAAEDIFNSEAIDSVEVLMGVDGVLSAGFVYVPIKWDINFQADSASNFIFDTWWTQMQIAKDVYPASAIILLNTIGTKWAFTNGYLTSYKPMPDAHKLLMPRKFGITWNNLSPAPIS